MSFTAKYISYKQTGAFSKIITDLLDDTEVLRPFYEYPAGLEGIKRSILHRSSFSTNRKILVTAFQKQYRSVQVSEAVSANLESLSSEKTFTVCTAHQPNIFTGHLYFIYKILHAVKLAEDLKVIMPDLNFVPVYYMGSEDADLQELGEVTIHGKKYEWKTGQTGAIGRMKIDRSFMDLLDEMEGQLSVEKYGNEILARVKAAYRLDQTIEQATFEFVNGLFGEYGLLIFLPDNPAFKAEFSSIIKKELTEQFSHQSVSEMISRFPAEYKVQAAGRQINLFYLKDDFRERIERIGDVYHVANTSLSFSKEEIDNELRLHPERFSPNVILRPVFQELILPNIAFIGGGGELAYWLELKKVFETAEIPFPQLILRNSFTVIPFKIWNKIADLQVALTDLFKSENFLLEELVKKESGFSLNLENEKKLLREVYQKMKVSSTMVDVTLNRHTDALMEQALKRVEQLEKKMLKAEKKKFEARMRQIHKIKGSLFPAGVLQERIENILPYYAVWGIKFISSIYQYSKGLEQKFCFLVEDEIKNE